MNSKAQNCLNPEDFHHRKKIMKNTIATLLVGMSLAACGGGTTTPAAETATGSQKIAELEKSGQLPILDRTETLTGIDADKNGIRDDIDRHIESTYSSPREKASAQEFARAIQNTLTIDASIRQQADMAAAQITKAMSCRSAAFADDRHSTGSEMVYKIEALTANTKQRMKKYLAFNKAMDGSVIELDSGDQFCE